MVIFLGNVVTLGRRTAGLEGWMTLVRDFGGPHFVASDSQGRVHATAGFCGHLQQFSQTGEYRNTWRNKSDEPGGYGGCELGGLKVTVGPIEITADRHDRVLVSSLTDRVQYFDTDGRQWGS